MCCSLLRSHGAPRAANWFDLIINMFSSCRPTTVPPPSPEVFYVSKSASLSVWCVFPRSAGRLPCSEVLKAPPAMVTGCLARSCLHVVLPCDILSRCVPLSMPDVTTALLRDLSHTLSPRLRCRGAPNPIPAPAVVPPRRGTNGRGHGGHGLGCGRVVVWRSSRRRRRRAEGFRFRWS